MTTKKDNFKLRNQKLGTGLEESLGVPRKGFQDPTGEFPKREYNFGSSINHAARGIKINNLYTVVEILVYHLTLQTKDLQSFLLIK